MVTDEQQYESHGDMTDIHPLTLRWRIHEGQIPLRRRHLRSLESFALPDPLMAWLLQRLEWAVDNLLDKDKDGVLVLSIDPQKDVVASLDTLREQPRLTRDNLVVKDGLVAGAQHEGAPLEGSVWSERDGVLHVSCEELVTATGTLARDLAQTLGLPLELRPQKLAEIDAADAVFLISDEFGFIPFGDAFASKASSVSVSEPVPEPAASSEPLSEPAASPESTPIPVVASATARIEECFAKLW
jgi:hypothetical protein